jgi:hypothetical protein
VAKDDWIGFRTAIDCLIDAITRNPPETPFAGIEGQVRAVGIAALVLGLEPPMKYSPGSKALKLRICRPDIGDNLLTGNWDSITASGPFTSVSDSFVDEREFALEALQEWRRAQEADFAQSDKPPQFEKALETIPDLMQTIDKSSRQVASAMDVARKYRDAAACRASDNAAQQNRLGVGEPGQVGKLADECKRTAGVAERLCGRLQEFLDFTDYPWSRMDRVNGARLWWEHCFELATSDPVMPLQAERFQDLHRAYPIPENALVRVEREFSDAAARFRERLAELAAVVSAAVEIVVDENRFQVRWGGKKCTLGPTQEFRLLQVLVQNKGIYVPYERILSAVNAPGLVTPKHIKGRLVNELRDAGMEALADSITGVIGKYGLCVSL